MLYQNKQIFENVTSPNTFQIGSDHRFISAKIATNKLKKKKKKITLIDDNRIRQNAKEHIRILKTNHEC